MTSILPGQGGGAHVHSQRGLFSHARRNLLVLAGSVLLAGLPLAAQTVSPHGGGTPAGSMIGHPDEPLGSPDPAMQKKMEQARETQRQRDLVADTQKLFQLAQQLRDEVAKSKSDELSVDVVKTSAQIEKLAKSVNEKMRGQ